MPEGKTAEARARRRVETLLGEVPLPDGVAVDGVFVERVRIGQLDLFMVGLTAALGAGVQALGSAAGPSDFPVDRAFFELLERISVLLVLPSGRELVLRDEHGARLGSCGVHEVFPADSEPERVRASLSNGVALHRTWEQACEAARAELVERDRVLRSFRGAGTPRPVAAYDTSLGAGLAPDYELQTVAFDTEDRELEYRVRGVFLFPRMPAIPLAYGFAAARSEAAALTGAAREALQRLAFLFGEQLPHDPPEPSPTPDYHQEFYLVPAHHARLHDWLAGRRGTSAGGPTFNGPAVRFADLTPPSLTGRVAVARALSAEAAPLLFGADRTHEHTEPHPIA
jgi:hypothetical protein